MPLQDTPVSYTHLDVYKRQAVQWPAVNEYTDTDGTTRNFAEKYRFHVTPAADMPADDPNEEGYDIRFTCLLYTSQRRSRRRDRP